MLIALQGSIGSMRPSDVTAPSRRMHPSTPQKAIMLCALSLLLGCDDPSGPLPLTPEPDEWVLGVLPDTQHYSERCPDIFEAQTEWLRAHADLLQLRFVAHLGDITEHGIESEWQAASTALGLLDGEVPYSILPGNHDIGVDGDARDRMGDISTWFPPSRFGETLRGTHPEGTIENSFHRLDTTVGPACVLALEFGPRATTVEWARAQLEGNRDCTTILTTHAFLYDDGERYDATMMAQLYHPDSYGIAPDAHDGEALFGALVVPFPQVRLVLSGHVLGTGVARRIDRRTDGTVAIQMLSNFQQRGPCGGDGFLRLIAISQEGIRVRTYSPTEDTHLPSDDHTFDIPFSE